MNDDLQKRITEALANPQNMGELPNADAIGTVGNSECGEMLRMWIKYKEEKGKKVIDRATFQSFGCETAIAGVLLQPAGGAGADSLAQQRIMPLQKRQRPGREEVAAGRRVAQAAARAEEGEHGTAPRGGR